MAKAITINELAELTAHGFADLTDKVADVTHRLDNVTHRLDKIQHTVDGHTETLRSIKAAML